MSLHHDTNGEGVRGAGGAGGGVEECEAEEAGSWGARALAGLEALRAGGALCDVRLAGEGGAGSVAAHRALLAAASPYLLAALHAPGEYRVPRAAPPALEQLVRWVYAGRGEASRAVYEAAWRLRVECVRARVAAVLVRRALHAGHAPSVLAARDLPDLPPHLRLQLHAHIARHFDAMCESGAVSSLPTLTIEILQLADDKHKMQEDSDSLPLDAPDAVAEAALALLREKMEKEGYSLEELCTETLLAYEEGGRLKDVASLPAHPGESGVVSQYRATRRPPAPAPPPERDLPFELGARAAPRGDWERVAAGGGRALLALGARAVLVRVRRARAGAGGGAGEGGEARGQLARGRAAHGACALDGRLLVVGGYDRAEALRDAETYDPATNAWSAWGGAGLRAARARFGAARLGGGWFALGGSDGHAELASVEVFSDGAWRARAALPVARAHAAAAADEERQHLYCVGGWSNGLPLRDVHRYSPLDDSWTEMPPLEIGRSQCGAAVWRGALWAVGGSDAWHCLASVERLSLTPGGVGAGARWQGGPALGAARRAAALAAWRGALVAAGGSDGAASLRRTELLLPDAETWRAGPPLQRPRAALSLCALGEALFAVGGFSGKEFLPCVETLHSLDGAWTLLRDPPAPHTDAILLSTPEDEKKNGDVSPIQCDIKTKLHIRAPEPDLSPGTVAASEPDIVHRNGDHVNGS